MRHISRLVVLLVLAAFGAAALILGSGAAAQGSGERTLRFTELEKGSTYTHIRNTKGAGPRANTQGDVLAFTNPLADEAGHVVGTLHASCVTTVGAKNFLRSTMSCTVVYVLREGNITGQAVVAIGKPSVSGAVTGGTGAYASARGTVASKDGPKGSVSTLTLVD